MHTDILKSLRLDNSGVPIYVQLREQILRSLGAGALAPGDQMPTMRQARRSYDDYLTDWKARQVPIGVRVIGVDQCLPIFGPQHRLDE